MPESRASSCFPADMWWLARSLRNKSVTRYRYTFKNAKCDADKPWVAKRWNLASGPVALQEQPGMIAPRVTLLELGFFLRNGR
jgi:hypothetical protein